MATKTMNVTTGDILSEIEKLLDSNTEREAGIFTTAELAGYLNVCQPTALRYVKPLLAAGLIVPARVKITDAVGRRTSTFGYEYVGNDDATD